MPLHTNGALLVEAAVMTLAPASAASWLAASAVHVAAAEAEMEEAIRFVGAGGNGGGDGCGTCGATSAPATREMSSQTWREAEMAWMAEASLTSSAAIVGFVVQARRAAACRGGSDDEVSMRRRRRRYFLYAKKLPGR